jgi:hypothetical protein
MFPQSMTHLLAEFQAEARESQWAWRAGVGVILFFSYGSSDI